MNQSLKVLESANNCTLLNGLNIPDADFCIKSRFFNAVLGRMEQGFTQKNVSESLCVSKRTVIDLEKGKIDKLTLVFKYIKLYGFDFAKNKKDLQQIHFKNKSKKC